MNQRLRIGKILPEKFHPFVMATVFAIPAFVFGIQARLERLSVALGGEAPSADATGFIALAGSELKWSYGWREPLFPQVLSAMNLVIGDPEQSLNLVCLFASCGVLIGSFLASYRLLGGFAAVVTAYLVAFSPIHLYMLWYRERSDLYLILLLAIWIAVSERRWRLLAVLTALATYLRITSLALVAITGVTWAAFVYAPTLWKYRGVKLNRNLVTALAKRSKPLALEVALCGVLVVPLFTYYKRMFGSWVYPQTIVMYDYYHRHTTGRWMIDVTKNFERNYVVPAEFSYFQFFSDPNDFWRKMRNSLYRSFVPRIGVERGTQFLSLPHQLFLFMYVLGIGFSLFRERGRNVLEFFIATTAPFLPLAFLPELAVRFFHPMLTLAFMLTGFGMQEVARCFGLLERSETPE